MKTLYVSDLDGTLLHPEKKITPFTAGIINELVLQGECFCYATARSLLTARQVTEGLDCPFPVICHNGTFIRDNKDGSYLLKNIFDKDMVIDLINRLAKAGVYPIVFSLIEGQERFSFIKNDMSGQQLRFISERKADPRRREVFSFDELTEGEIFYLSYIDSNERLMPLDRLCEGYGIHLLQKDTYDDFYWLEIMPENATKAKAARALAMLLRCERIVAFGDGLNDMELFKIADKAYAVANACDESKKIADAVIGSNDEDGVARWLKENVLTKQGF